MRRIGLVLALAMVGGGSVALADPQRNPVHASDRANQAALSPNDREFVNKAAVGGLAEVQLAKLALDKCRSTEVKQLARKMLFDHSKANTELKQIAERKHVDM